MTETHINDVINIKLVFIDHTTKKIFLEIKEPKNQWALLIEKCQILIIFD